MQPRSQRTIARAVEVDGIGFLTGADVRIRFLPAPPGEGLTFCRTDVADPVRIPARVEFTVPRERRTAISHHGITVELTEHVMAALAGLHIDNCRIELNAPEPPGCDGSSLAFAEALWDADAVDQGVPRKVLVIRQELSAGNDDRTQTVDARPGTWAGLRLSYTLDYGPASLICPQQVLVDVAPESFMRELAFARTFVLEQEVEALRALGYGKRTTARDLLVFGRSGIVDNALRAENECARHKALDCVGDFALIGCDLVGCIDAFRSGHRLNTDLVRRLKQAHAEQECPRQRHAA